MQNWNAHHNNVTYSKKSHLTIENEEIILRWKMFVLLPHTTCQLYYHRIIGIKTNKKGNSAWAEISSFNLESYSIDHDWVSSTVQCRMQHIKLNLACQPYLKVFSKNQTPTMTCSKTAYQVFYIYDNQKISLHVYLTNKTICLSRQHYWTQFSYSWGPISVNNHTMF